MKIRLPTLLLALLLLTTPCYAGGIAPDKQKHISVAAGMNLAMEAMGGSRYAWCAPSS